MANSYLHGKDASVYYTNYTNTPPSNASELQAILDHATKHGDFAIGYPNITGSWANMPVNGDTLYDGTVIDTAVLNKLDSNAVNWQLAPVFYWIHPEYDGDVDVMMVTNMFPSQYDISSIINDGHSGFIIVNLNGTDIYYLLAKSGTGTTTSSTYNIYKKSPFQRANGILNVIGFGSDAHHDYVYPSLGYYISDSSQGAFNTYAMQTSGQKDKFLFTNKSTYTSTVSFYLNALEDDYVPPVTKDDDPYNDPDSGEGVYDDDTSDAVNKPSLPTLSVSDTGFITLFNPTKVQLKSLADYMWSSAFSLDTFKKIFANPISAILGLSILPIPIPTSGTRNVSVGNISTGVSMPVVSQQFIEVDCGSVTVYRQRPGTYLDFSPYTKIEIYLPFIGTHPLQVDDVMGKTINVTYHVDILSGACTAFVKCGDSILYQFIGQCAISVPITGNDWTQAINGVINIAGSIGSMVLSGGATAPMSVGSIASTATNSLKPSVEKSGSVSGAGGLLGVKYPYLIITRPNRNVAQNQNSFIGYPTFKNKKMSSLEGFNSIMSVHLDEIPATQNEIDEIESLLRKGAIF